MPPPTAAAIRPKKTPRPPGKSQPCTRSGKRQPTAGQRPGRWRPWLAIAAAVVFLIAYVLDPGAVARLIGACLAGQFGPRVRVAAIGGLVLVGCVLAWALFRPRPRPPAASVGRTRRRRASGKAKPAQPGPGEAAAAQGDLVPDQESRPRAPGQRASSRRPTNRS